MANERHDLKASVLDSALCCLKMRTARRLEQKGLGSFIGPHEVLGIITEEYSELVDAVRMDDVNQVIDELIDIAVGCVIGMASLIREPDSVSSVASVAKEEIKNREFERENPAATPDPQV